MSRPSSALRRLLALPVLLAVAAAAAFSAAPASAKEYRVFSCRLASWQTVPLGDWAFEYDTVGPGQDLCSTHGFAMLSLGTRQAGTTDWTGLAITMPEGLTATRLRADRWVRLRAGLHPDIDATIRYQLRSGAGGVRWTDTGAEERDVRCFLKEGCTELAWDTEAAGRVTLDLGAAGARSIGLRVGCVVAGPPDGACHPGSQSRGDVRINHLDLTVRDDTHPAISSPSGSILQGGVRSGVQTLAFNATDVGAGVYQAIVSIDGTEAGRVRPDGSPLCADAGGLPDVELEFTRLQPCLRSVGASLDIDTARLSNGTHRLTAVVRDAADNLSNVISQDFTVANAAPPAPTPAPVVVPTPAASVPPETANPGGPNGTGGIPASGALGHRGEPKRLSVVHGGRRVVKGRLLDATGRPIQGAAIDVAERIELPGASWTPVGTAQTDATGTYRWEPATGSRRRVRFSYAGTRGGAYRAVREVVLDVRAKMTIAATPKTVARRGLVGLAGTVALEGLPTRGVRVEVQVRRRGGWQTVSSRALDPRGRWTFRHRLQTARNATLAFRARLQPTGGVASAPSSSATARVRVR